MLLKGDATSRIVKANTEARLSESALKWLEGLLKPLQPFLLLALVEQSTPILTEFLEGFCATQYPIHWYCCLSVHPDFSMPWFVVPKQPQPVYMHCNQACSNLSQCRDIFIVTSTAPGTI